MIYSNSNITGHQFIRMVNKDYYQVLQLSPSATVLEIRKAYRKLALEFHPDRNPSAQAATLFVMIQEAYDVLSNPLERKKYDQSRFTGQLSGRRIATTVAEIRLMSEELVQRIKKTNPDRINRDKLVLDLQAVLSVYHIQLWENQPDEQQTELLLNDLLFCIQYLDLKDCLQFTNTLLLVKGLNSNCMNKIIHFLRLYKRNHYWNRYKIWLALIMALITCILIYKA